MHKIVFTCGDINGIGPELVFKCLNKNLLSKSNKIIFVIPKNVFLNTALLIKPKFKFKIVKNIPSNWDHDEVIICDIGYCRQTYGKITKTAGLKSYKAILKSCELLKNCQANAVVTAPISKLAFQKASIDFPGHTELYANFFGVKTYAMMFVSNKFKAGLVTIHIPINKIRKELTKSRLRAALNAIENSLRCDFNITEPNIAILGLNPHAGENGKIGNEENTIIRPVLDEFKSIVTGPFAPDAFFGNKIYKNFDCTLGMYHDQVLIPFKLLNFNKGVNYTAGLPIVRTSPDHGTAFDIAGTGKVNPESMLEAYKYAKIILKNRKL